MGIRFEGWLADSAIRRPDDHYRGILGLVSLASALSDAGCYVHSIDGVYWLKERDQAKELLCVGRCSDVTYSDALLAAGRHLGIIGK